MTNQTDTNTPYVSKIFAGRPLSGEEFYWKHQSHLQSSSLTFKTLISETPTNQHLKQSTPFLPPFLAPQERDQIEFQHKECAQYVPQVIASSYLKQTNYGAVITCKERPSFLEKCFLWNETSDVLTPECSLNINRKTIQSTLPFLKKWNNHLIYMKENRVEIALQTNSSLRKLRQLKVQLQQWLSTKNLRLKQLIINGVQQ